jgi:hypothetical protein
VGYKAAPAKGKSILPLILIGVGVVAVAAVLFLVVLKTKYDIVGTWNYTSTGKWPVTGQIVFTGTKESGTVSWVGLVDVGTYSVDGKNVTFTFGYQQYGTTTCTGKFNGKNEISGTYLYTDEHNTDTATFTMTR